MKNLWLTGILVLAVLPWANLAFAGEAPATLTHPHRGIAIPPNALIANPVYRLELHVSQNVSIDKLLIGLPKGLRVKDGIEVEDISDSKSPARKLASNFSMLENRITVAFPQPVPANTVIRVNLKGVKPPYQQGNVWLFPISVIASGTDFAQPLETIRVTTRTPP